MKITSDSEGAEEDIQFNGAGGSGRPAFYILYRTLRETTLMENQDTSRWHLTTYLVWYPRLRKIIIFQNLHVMLDRFQYKWSRFFKGKQVGIVKRLRLAMWNIQRLGCLEQQLSEELKARGVTLNCVAIYYMFVKMTCFGVLHHSPVQLWLRRKNSMETLKRAVLAKL